MYFCKHPSYIADVIVPKARVYYAGDQWIVAFREWRFQGYTTLPEAVTRAIAEHRSHLYYKSLEAGTAVGVKFLPKPGQIIETDALPTRNWFQRLFNLA